MRQVLRSWWVLLTLLPFGWLNWSAFLYTGLRARRPLWIMFAAVYFAAAATSATLISVDLERETDSWLTSAGTGIGLAVWGATFAHALSIRRTYLGRMDALEDPRLDRAEHELRLREVALELVRENPRRARDLGVGRPSLNGAFHGGLVDLNHASVDEIARLPGIDAELAMRAVTLRGEIGGFDSVLDFAHLLDVEPELADGLQDRAIVLPRYVR